MYQIFDKFEVPIVDREPGQVDLKAVIATQAQQPHAGFLCTDKDQGEMRFHERYKTLRLNEKFVHLTVGSDLEEKLMDREHMQLAARLEFENAQGPKNGALQGLSFMETRKINEQNLTEMKGRMAEHIKKKTQEFRLLKEADKVEVRREELAVLEDKQQDVLK